MYQMIHSLIKIFVETEIGNNPKNILQMNWKKYEQTMGCWKKIRDSVHKVKVSFKIKL